MSTGTSQLIDEWKAGGMEEDDEGGVRPRDGPVQQQRRLARCVVAALLVLIVEVLAILITVGLRSRSPPSPTVWPKSPSAEGVRKLEQVEADVHHLKNPSAMLTASGINNNSMPYLQWESERGTAYCEGGFTYSNGDLVVPRTGYYRVFLQITYNNVPVKCSHVTLQSNVLYIHDSYPSDNTLLSAVDTVMCSEYAQIWSRSYYTAGLFQLEANGRLHATSSHPNNISNNEHEVFFGAELLPD